MTFQQLYDYARSQGVNRKTAKGYATLMAWGEQLGYPPVPITGGGRTPAWTRAAQARWDAGDRRGLVVRPATDSRHHTGDAFDLPTVSYLDIYGALAPYVPLTWGASFNDPNHFARAS